VNKCKNTNCKRQETNSSSDGYCDNCWEAWEHVNRDMEVTRPFIIGDGNKLGMFNYPHIFEQAKAEFKMFKHHDRMMNILLPWAYEVPRWITQLEQAVEGKTVAVLNHDDNTVTIGVSQ